MRYVATIRPVGIFRSHIDCLKSGDYSFWNENRIKGLTNFGNGTFEDWVAHKKRNHCWFCTYEEYEKLCDKYGIKKFPFECSF